MSIPHGISLIPSVMNFHIQTLSDSDTDPTDVAERHPLSSTSSVTSSVTRQAMPGQDTDLGIETIQNTLRQTQLTASIAHAKARENARNPSSASHPRKSRSSRASSTVIEDLDTKTGLEEVATKLFGVGVPWPELWAIRGAYVVAASHEKQHGHQVTDTDDLGIEILSYVPHHLVRVFLSDAGQMIVRGTMQTVRGSHIHRVRLVASTIFGHGFAQEWFLSKYDRNSLPEFQKLLGVTATPGGKKYPLLPPILYPNGSLDKNALFLNPALAKIMKVILFGPTSLSGKKSSGPTPNGVRWGLQEATPGMIALAAIIARFLLSPDEDFSQTGGKSGISYIGSFKAYKEMIMAHATTPRFKRIFSSFNELLFGTKPATPKQDVHVDQGDYDDEIQEYLREDSPPPPAEPTDTIAEDNIDETPPTLPSIDLDETPPSLRPGHHPSTSITLQESNTVKTSSLTISITTVPSEPQAEVDAVVAPPKKGRPAARKKITSPASDATDITPAPTTRNTRTSTRQAAPPPEQGSQPTTRASGRRRAKD